MFTKHRFFLLITLILTAALLLSACGKTITSGDVSEQAGLTAAQTDKEKTAGATETALTASTDMFTDRDYEVGYDVSETVTVTLNGASAACGDSSVTVENGRVTLTKEGTYLLTGSFEGTVAVDMDKTAKPHIILKDAAIVSADGAALYVAQADKVFVTLADGSANTLSNGGSFDGAEEGVDGAVFSRDDITFNGSGALTVESPAGHGIVGKDDVAVTGGAYEIVSASHGIDANDSVRIDVASLNISAGKDGVHCENSGDADKGFVWLAGGSLTINAEGDGISAGTNVTIEDGAVDILAGGGSENAEKKTSDSWGQFGGMFGGGRPDRNGGSGERPEMPQGGFSAPDGERPEMPEGGFDFPDGEVPEMPEGGFPGMPDSDNGGTAELADEAEQSLSAAPPATGQADDSDSASIKGVKAGGDIVVNGGAVTADAADDAIHAGGSVSVNGGTLTLKTGDDGVHADGTLTVTDGTLQVTESYEGLEALVIDLRGGEITVNADDDGLNAAGGSDDSGFGGARGGDKFGGKGGFGATEGAEINLSGGTISIQAAGDGIDSNGSVTISGGDILADCPTAGDTSPFDYATTASITGGTLIATGSGMMAEGFTSAGQGVISLRTDGQPGGTALTVADESGVLLSAEPENPYNYLLVSSPDLTAGQNYTLTVGGNSQSVTAG